MKRKKTYAQLKRELDRVFSLWVRWKAADKGGHFIPRHYLSTRWIELNVQPQCYRCNIALRGNYPEFAYKLGHDNVGWLLKEKRQLVKFSGQDLQGMIDSVKADLATLGVRT